MSLPPYSEVEKAPLPSADVNITTNTEADASNKTNPAKIAHDHLQGGQVLLWLGAFIHMYPVVALVTMSPHGLVGTAATYNIAIGAIALIVYVIVANQKIPTPSRPISASTTLACTFSFLAWAAAFPLMFVALGANAKTVVVEVSSDSFRNLILACGITGACLFAVSLFNGYNALRLAFSSKESLIEAHGLIINDAIAKLEKELDVKVMRA